MDSFWKQLSARQLPDGGFPAFAAGDHRADATAWAAIALSLEDAEAASGAGDRLIAAQLPDGRVPVLANHPEAAWVTPLAVLAWRATGRDEAAVRALDFLTGYTGIHFEKPPDSPGHDTAIPGWPWISETHSWVEPTALAILAYRVYGRGGEPRVRDGLRLLADRRLPHGGWNYGNTITFGAEMRPTPDSTGIVLTALPQQDPEPLESSFDYLERTAPGLRTPLGLSWAVLGLSAWGRRPAGAETWIEETLGRQEELGTFSTTDLALLLTASRCPEGLFACLTGEEVDG